ncbi:D-aminoacyl-tRNA deacylase [bacterium]|nr:D-aminoacyl-tRNA deacylase [bacterium]
MKIVLQRTTGASVSVNNQQIGAIGEGVVLLVGFGEDDTEEHLTPKHLAQMAKKICELRIFADEKSCFQESLLQRGGGVLLVPQFTLYGTTRKGRRPDFTGALEPQLAKKHFLDFIKCFQAYKELGAVQTGEFGADMAVELINDGPVTLLLEYP